MRKILFLVLVAALCALPVLAEGENNEIGSENYAYSVESDTDSGALAVIQENQKKINDNMVFCAVALVSTLGIVVGYCSGRDLLNDLWR